MSGYTYKCKNDKCGVVGVYRTQPVLGYTLLGFGKSRKPESALQDGDTVSVTCANGHRFTYRVEGNNLV